MFFLFSCSPCKTVANRSRPGSTTITIFAGSPSVPLPALPAQAEEVLRRSGDGAVRSTALLCNASASGSAWFAGNALKENTWTLKLGSLRGLEKEREVGRSKSFFLSRWAGGA